jgi:hypothetical protein
MLSEKQKEAVMYLCREWRKYHHVTEVDEFAFKVAEAVLALERPAAPEPEPVWRKCPQCTRTNSVETWNKRGGKCPNCDYLFEKDQTSAPEPAAQEPTFTLKHVFAILNKALTVKVWDCPAECVGWILAQFAPEPKPPEWRVQIIPDPDTNDCYDVRLDGKYLQVFAGREHAERYAAGVRAELAKEASNG